MACNQLRKDLINEFGGVCEWCGSTHKLQFAHRKKKSFLGASRGSCVRANMVNNNPNDFILLCEKCHRTQEKALK